MPEWMDVSGGEKTLREEKKYCGKKIFFSRLCENYLIKIFCCATFLLLGMENFYLL